MDASSRGDACFFFQAEDGIRDLTVTGVQTCALPISLGHASRQAVQVPQRSGTASSGGRSAVVSTRPMKKYEPRPGAIRFVFLPTQPSPAAAARSRSSTALVSTEARLCAPAAALT